MHADQRRHQGEKDWCKLDSSLHTLETSKLPYLDRDDRQATEALRSDHSPKQLGSSETSVGGQVSRADKNQTCTRDLSLRLHTVDWVTISRANFRIQP